MKILGYTNKLSVEAGDQVEFKVSAAEKPYNVEFVRLRGVDTTAEGRPVREEQLIGALGGIFQGRNQPLRPGSYGLVTPEQPVSLSSYGFQLWVFPTLADRECQTLLSVEGSDPRGSWSVVTTVEGFELRLGAGQSTVKVPVENHTGAWIKVSGGVGQSKASLQIEVDGQWPSQRASAANEVDLVGAVEVFEVRRIVIGARLDNSGYPTDCFNGRIENPAIFSLPPAEIGSGQRAIAQWDFSVGIDSLDISDVSGNGLNGVLFNRPARGIRSHSWSGEHVRYQESPSEWAAIHFHEDDLNDANWKTDFTLRIPDGTHSGVYAAKVEQDGTTEYLPFYIRGGASSGNKVLFLAPTNTYLAYANEHLGFGERGEAHEKRMRDKIQLNATDTFIHTHPELGLSIYDRHADSSGVMHSSWNRPVVNFQPNYITWLNASRRHFAADFFILGWLESLGQGFDVATDEDLHNLGESLLSRYDVVVSGSHPEYPTSSEMRSLKSFVAKGGKIMYLGGNGWYWVTSFGNADTRTLECRRGYSGERNWTSHPAELMHSTTGEIGGLYTHRGQGSRLFFGVASAGVGWGTASGYTRTDDSYSEDIAFLFDGIEEKLIGDFGYVLDGAAGDELDSADFENGTPSNARIILSSRHNDTYYPFLESVTQVEPNVSGTHNPNVRADVVYIDTGGGGKLFSVGSICWAGSLAFNEYKNNVAALSTNVLRHFLKQS
ncbi:N,N-dimethylformamidase beta subunit family domain-containing protein [Brucella sp. NBRC 113783]|uniref:N,N-dimethylformamidase beta subunit family domain-containing protein n=1 Tax=Brucella sp. NBRC 113783 TaxID=3075478 RepID=UPI0029BFE54A|nr:N,N-dimethylformamidase beta subunit family domain-containing protein [Brucella sp. NBRC 113783]MDX4075593.1 DUF6605 domain-containing protein [Brucella sp. NBRC 113783]